MKQITIGDCTLYNGNCLDIVGEIGPVYSVVSDPPYELAGFKSTTADSYYGNRTMEFHFDEKGVTEEVVLPAMKAALSKAQSFHVFCNAEQFGDISKVARSLGFTPKPWAKLKACPPPPMPGNWWPSGFELAIYGYKSGAYFGDQTGKRLNIMRFDGYRHGIRASEKVDHPTQKWLPMIRYLVETLVPKGEVAFDPFMGSGTTGVACALTGRKFIGIEKEERYFDMAVKRIQQAYDTPELRL